MLAFVDRLLTIFTELDARISALMSERAETGGPKIARAEVRILGQMSLLANERVSGVVTLAETGDLDAHLRTEYVVEKELKIILRKHGLVYDETSNEIWIPKGAKYEPLFDLKNVVVSHIDAESALVSKAVKAPEKNRILIQDSLASAAFPDLADRIVREGGDLSYFLEDSENSK